MHCPLSQMRSPLQSVSLAHMAGGWFVCAVSSLGLSHPAMTMVNRGTSASFSFFKVKILLNLETVIINQPFVLVESTSTCAELYVSGVAAPIAMQKCIPCEQSVLPKSSPPKTNNLPPDQPPSAHPQQQPKPNSTALVVTVELADHPARPAAPQRSFSIIW